jgi:acetyl-CoA C-acetyltransferase
MQALDLPMTATNPNGGAIALGHPYGASGAVLVVRLFSRMVRERNGGLGIAMLAAAGGLGAAAAFMPV